MGVNASLSPPGTSKPSRRRALASLPLRWPSPHCLLILCVYPGPAAGQVPCVDRGDTTKSEGTRVLSGGGGVAQSPGQAHSLRAQVITAPVGALPHWLGHMFMQDHRTLHTPPLLETFTAHPPTPASTHVTETASHHAHGAPHRQELPQEFNRPQTRAFCNITATS